MIEHNDISEIDLQLKPISYRLLRTGEYILIVAGKEPLVVNDTFFQAIKHKHYFSDFTDSEKDILFESGFFCRSIDYSLYIVPQETIGVFTTLKKVLLFIVQILSIMTILYSFSVSQALTSIQKITFEIPILQIITYILLFTFLSTVIHELMHMFYANTFRMKRGGLKLHFLKSVATVSMTHIWVWSSFSSRIAAVAAGVVSDTFILAIITMIRLNGYHWMLDMSIYILGLKIMWQFGFHRNCDGHILALLIFDNPLIMQDAKDKNNFNRKDVTIWRWLIRIGYLVDCSLIFFFIKIVLAYINR